MDLNIMVIGSTGYLGSAVVKRFNKVNLFAPRMRLEYPPELPYTIDDIDVLINCAGVQGSAGESETQPFWKTDKVTTINYISPVCLMNAVLPSMKRNNFGRIINLSGGGAADWSRWDIGPRDYWGSSEIVECFHAMLANVETNLKLFVFPPIEGGVIYGVPTFENLVVLALVVSGIILVFILIERIIHNGVTLK